MDKEMFTKCVLEAEDTLYHVAKTILHNDSDCEDAVQEAILQAYANVKTLRNQAYFKTWLVRILINECYKICRNQKQSVPYEEYMEQSQAESENRQTGLWDIIKSLDEKYRMVIVLYYVEGYSVKEVAQILRIPSGTVKSRLSHARKIIEQKLRKEEVYLYG